MVLDATRTGHDYGDDVELLHQTVQRYSPSGDERRAVDYLVGAMQARGFAAERDAAGNAVGVIGRGPTEVLLLGHIDTVPGWIEPRIEHDILHGRGSVDAKGPLCTFVAAASGLPETALAKIRITVVGAVEEEIASSKGAHHVLPRCRPDFIVIGEPSSADAITIGYKGRLGIRFQVEREMAHRAAKSSSSAEAAFELWRTVRDFADEFNRERPKIFDQLDATLTRVRTADEPLRDRTTLRIDVRIPQRFATEALRSVCTAAALEIGGDIEFRSEVAAVRAGKNNRLVRAFLEAIRGHGERPRFKLKTGTSDMNLAAAEHPQTPMLAYGPGDSSLDHTPREQTAIEEYRRAVSILRAVLTRLAD